MTPLPPPSTPVASCCKRLICLGGILWLGALAGCSTLNVPRAEAYPASGQHKARAVQHWDLLADDVAARIAAKVAGEGMEKTAFHILPTTHTAFNRAFADLLLTRLVNRGLIIATVPNPDNNAGAFIRFDTQVVEHAAAGYNWPELPLTTLAAGLAVLRDSWMHVPSTASGVATGLAMGVAGDVSGRMLSGTASGGPTRTELLVSASLELGQRYLGRTSDIYYIDPDDVRLFVPPPPPPPPPPLAPVKNWKVVGS